MMSFYTDYIVEKKYGEHRGNTIYVSVKWLLCCCVMEDVLSSEYVDIMFTTETDDYIRKNE